MLRGFIAALLFSIVTLVQGVAHAVPASEFPIPPELKPRVEFWANVFGAQSRNTVVFHDKKYPERILSTKHFPPLSTKRAERRLQWKARKQGKRREIARLKEILLRLHKMGDKPGPLESEVWKIWDMYSGDLDKDRFKNAAARLRGQTGLKEKTRKALQISGRYMPHMEEIFRNAGMPLALTRLPLVESSFNVKAYSKVGAAGIWQFMPYTAKKYMRYDDVADQRMDPLFATAAAAKHLRDDIEYLKRWPLAVTAYNHGRGGLRNGLKKTGGKTLVDLIKHYKGRSFGFASKNFYAEFLGALQVANNEKKYFGAKVKKDPALKFSMVKTRDFLAYATVIELTGLSAKEFKIWNPSFTAAVRDGRLYVPPNYPIRVPEGRAKLFIKRYAALAPAKKLSKQRRLAYARHKVRKGQTLAAIAKRYGTSTKALKSLNKIRNANRLRVGQVLKVPGKGSAKAGRTKISRKPVIHRVKRGETVAVIAGRYGISSKALMKANRIKNPKKLRAGQRLKIYGGKTDAGPSSSSRRVASSWKGGKSPFSKKAKPARTVASAKAGQHTVKRGQTLALIARRYGTSVNALLRANGLRNANRLQVGQVLNIPGKARASYKGVHRVRSGQTLKRIAQRYGVSLKRLLKANGIRNPNKIKVGQLLKIPG